MPITTSRLQRIQIRVDELISKQTLTLKQEKEIAEVYKQLLHVREKASRYVYGLYGCYILLYVSLVASITQSITVIGDVVNVLVIFSSILGSTVLLALIALIHTVLNMYVIDGHMLATNIISIAKK